MSAATVIADRSSPGAAPPLLDIRGLSARYGAIEALHDVSLRVGAGEAVALVGANGAGKSTLMKCIMGLLPCAAGSIGFAGATLSGRPVHERAALGIGYAPEGRRVFPGLTVNDNLLVASRDRDGGRAQAEVVYSIFPALKEKSGAMGWALSGGQQQMLAIGRALMLQPRLLLLDEPSLGLSPRLTQDVLDRVAGIARTGTAVLIAEQNVHKALAITHRAYVIKLGRLVQSGPSDEFLRSNEIANAFLGA